MDAGTDAQLLAKLRHYAPGLDLDSDECQLWFGGMTSEGYGCVDVHGTTYSAHRALWLALGLPLAPGEHLHHTCFRKDCVNVRHLTPQAPGAHARLHAALRRVQRIGQRAR